MLHFGRVAKLTNLHYDALFEFHITSDLLSWASGGGGRATNGLSHAHNRAAHIAKNCPGRTIHVTQSIYAASSVVSTPPQ